MTHHTKLADPPTWRRALRAFVRALSLPAPSEADAFGRRDDETVFQPRPAVTRAPPLRRINRR